MPTSDDSTGTGNRPVRIHDKFFKDIFRMVEYTITLMRIGAPQPLFQIIDWSTLRLESQSIQAHGHTERTTDLMFTAKLKNGQGEASIILMFEHKSYKDRNLCKQMARYQFLRYLQDDFQSLIVPIVVVQGTAGNDGPVSFSDLFSDISSQHLKVLMQYSVNFQCVLIDVDEMNRQGLAQQSNIDVIIQAMSKVRDFEASELQDLLERVRYVRKDQRDRIFRLVLGYIWGYNQNIEPQEILNLQTKTTEEQHMVLSALETFREEGRVEGREEGRVEGREVGRVEGREEGRVEGREEYQEEIITNMLKQGMKSEEVSKLTNLNQEQVETILHKINGALKR